MTITCKKSKLVLYDYSRHIWESHGLKLFKIKFANHESEVSHLLKYLSKQEKERANRYHFTKDKNRFTICRALLKILLAKTTNLDVSKVSIEKDENKKPYLSSHPHLFFNVAHTEGCGLIAISNKPIGVDIEKINPSFDYSKILEQVFTGIEIAELMNSEFPLRAFYHQWTRKEAVVKAMGIGITDFIKEVPCLDGIHESSFGSFNSIKSMEVSTFEFDGNYIGALACSNGISHSEGVPCFELHGNTTMLNENLNT